MGRRIGRVSQTGHSLKRIKQYGPDFSFAWLEFLKSASYESTADDSVNKQVKREFWLRTLLAKWTEFIGLEIPQDDGVRFLESESDMVLGGPRIAAEEYIAQNMALHSLVDFHPEIYQYPMVLISLSNMGLIHRAPVAKFVREINTKRFCLLDYNSIEKFRWTTHVFFGTGLGQSRR